MITIGNVIEVCNIINETSSKLTMIIGEQVELRLITPALPGIDYNKHINDPLMHTILSLVCEQFMTTKTHLRGNSRLRHITDARKITAYLLHKHVPGITDAELAYILGMERSTAHYNRTQAADLLITNNDFRFQYNQILKRLQKAISDNG